MTNAELKEALTSKFPVMFDGIQYQRVCEIVYRMPEDKLVIHAGLLDKNGNCIVYARPAKVTRADNPDGNASGRKEET